jgi:hypothetical protein
MFPEGGAKAETHVALIVPVGEPLELGIESFGQGELPARDR